jgi:hypothetical protein
MEVNGQLFHPAKKAELILFVYNQTDTAVGTSTKGKIPMVTKNNTESFGFFDRNLKVDSNEK